MGKGPRTEYGSKYIGSPDELWKSYLDYKEWAHNNPWIKHEAIKSGENAGRLIDIPHERPLTLWEFASCLGLSIQGLQHYGVKEGYESYFSVYARIKADMSAQRISGGLVEAYNANLVARIDGIKDHSEIEGKIEPLVFLTEDGKKLLEIKSEVKDA